MPNSVAIPADVEPQHTSASGGRGWQQTATVWGAVFFALLTWRFPYLTRPPYEDLAWLWQEANFLAEHNFDYYQLWTVEPRADQVIGGGRSYLISIVPTFLAALMKLCRTSEQVFIVYHLIYLACGASVFTIVWSVLRRACGDLVAWLAALAMLLTPAFSVRLEQIGMDLPMATAALISAVFIWRGRYQWAAALSLLAFLIKPTGAIMTAANLGLLVLFLFADPDTRPRRKVWLGLVSHAVTLGVEVGLILISGMMTIDRRWSPPSHVSVPRLRSAPYWVPDVMVVFAVATVVTLIAATVWFFARRRDQTQNPPHALALLGQYASQQPIAALSWLVMLGSLLAMTKVLFMPRYLTLSIPFLYLALATLLAGQLSKRGVGAALFSLIIVVNVTNAHGRLYPSLVDVHGPEFERINLFSPRASIALERSFEYRSDHEATIESHRLLEAAYPDAAIFTEDTYYVYLTLPRLGYVDRPLTAYRISDYPAALEKYLELSGPDVESQPIFLVGGLSGFLVEGPETAAEILYHDQAEIPLIAFRQNWSDGLPDRATRERWYFEHLCPSRRLGQRGAALAAAEARLSRGDVDAARISIALGLEKFPNDRELLLVAADASIRKADYETAIDYCERALRLDPAELEAWSLLATASNVDIWMADEKTAGLSHLLIAGRVDELLEVVPEKAPNTESQLVAGAAYLLDEEPARARQVLTDVVEESQGDPWANLLLSAIAIQQTDYDQAIQHLSRIENNESPAVQVRRDVLLGIIHIREGEIESARDAFQAALEHDNESIDARYGLGLIEMKTGRDDEAEAHLSAVREAVPQFSDGVNALGVLLARQGRYAEARQCFLDAVEYQEANETARRNLTSLDRRNPRVATR